MHSLLIQINSDSLRRNTTLHSIFRHKSLAVPCGYIHASSISQYKPFAIIQNFDSIITLIVIIVAYTSFQVSSHGKTIAIYLRWDIQQLFEICFFFFFFSPIIPDQPLFLPSSLVHRVCKQRNYESRKLVGAGQVLWPTKFETIMLLIIFWRPGRKRGRLWPPHGSWNGMEKKKTMKILKERIAVNIGRKRKVDGRN